MGLTNDGITSATGFQTRFLDKEFLCQEFINRLQTKEQVFEFIESGLRSGSDVYKKGGHVIAKYKDKLYSLNYDNKRQIVNDESSTLLDSKP